MLNLKNLDKYGQQNEEKLCSNKWSSKILILTKAIGIPPPLYLYNAKIFFSKTKVGRRNPHFVLKIDLCIAVRKMLYSGTIKYRREPLTCNRYIDYTVHQKTTTSQWRYSLKENTQSTTTATF